MLVSYFSTVMNKWLLRLCITAPTQTVVLTVQVFACSSVFPGVLADHLISYDSSRLMHEFFLADGNMPSLFHSTKGRVTVLSRAAIGQLVYAAVWAKLWKS